MLVGCLPGTTHARVEFPKPSVQRGNGGGEDSVEHLDLEIDGGIDNGDASPSSAVCLVKLVDVETNQNE